MQQLSTYLNTIITIIITASFISLLIPKGEMKKYVRFGAGVIVICCFANLISGFNSIELGDLHYATGAEYTQTDFNGHVRLIMSERLEREVMVKYGMQDIKITVGDDMRVAGVETADEIKKREIEAYLGVVNYD